MSPQTNRPIPVHPTPPVSPVSGQPGGRTGHQDSAALDAQDALTDLLFVQLDRSAEVYEIAGAVMAAGWRPPAQVIETADGIAELPTGTVIWSRQGDVASVDHGGVGEWTGSSTVVHLLGAGRLTVADLAAEEAAGTFSWTVLHTPGDTK